MDTEAVICFYSFFYFAGTDLVSIFSVDFCFYSVLVFQLVSWDLVGSCYFFLFLNLYAYMLILSCVLIRSLIFLHIISCLDLFLW